MDLSSVDIDSISDPTARVLVQLAVAQLEQQRQLNAQLQATIAGLETTLAKQAAQLEELRRLLFGRKSEKLPPVEREIRKRERDKETDAQRQQRLEASQHKRRERRDSKRALPVIEQTIEVVPETLVCGCGRCRGAEDFVEFGPGEVSERFEYVPAQLVRIRYVRKRRVCRYCRETIVTAPVPPGVVDGGHYGPGLYAHVIVSKCADSLPLHRQSKQLLRAGVELGRSTLCDLFHRAAELSRPLHRRLFELVAADSHVNADETTLSMQQKGGCKRAYVWTFVTSQIVAFEFSASRSGETPMRVLSGSSGVLQVDGYSGYNQVCVPDGRLRAGCWAHVRRRFFTARTSAAEEAQWALDRILELYEVEYAAAEQKVLGGDKHLAMRRAQSAHVLDKLKAWLEEQQPLHPPKSQLSVAIAHTVNNWSALTVFVSDVAVSLDNNASERALRAIAVGRKNFLFVGHEVAGGNLAALQSLVATCELHRVNAFEYLRDVLVRLESHPQSRIDELLPWNWQPTTDTVLPTSA